MAKITKYGLFILIFIIFSIVIVTPMNSHKQFTLDISVLLSVAIFSFSKKREVTIMLTVISLLMSSRYIFFRASQTLSFGSQTEAILGIGLFLAELYSFLMLFLGYFQSSFPLNRKIVPLPDDISTWPTVDVYIPTYNESLSVVQDTVLAAQNLEYPKDKLNVYILDDGKRNEFQRFALDAGVGYITRNDNAHAKAGNLNHAMTLTDGELICIFDCDHIATRIFLQATVGAFLKDPRLALVQTPHHFYSQDPFERNLYGKNKIPNEGVLFYGPIQQGNDNWDAAFFCGSCAVIRRTALDEVGGVATETVTEDAHTALKMQRKGWHSAYISIPLAGGLATERLALHVIQRNRWGRGMTQIFRLDNPLFGRGLTLPQRLCYLSSMLYFQFPWPRIVYITAPLTFLFFNLNVLYSSAELIFAYVLPHLVLSLYVNSRLNGRFRHSFWGEIYDMTLALHLAIPMVVTLLFPKRGKFNVTDKGDLLDHTYFDFHIARPHILFALLLLLGIGSGLVQLSNQDISFGTPYVLVLNIGWCVYNLLFLLGAIAVAREKRQVRQTIRIQTQIPAVLYYQSGIASRAITTNLSMGGGCVQVADKRHQHDPIIRIELELETKNISLPVTMVASDDDVIRLRFCEISLDHRRELVRIVFGRADAWIDQPPEDENLLLSFTTMLSCILRVYGEMLQELGHKLIRFIFPASSLHEEGKSA